MEMMPSYQSEVLRERMRDLMEEEGTITPAEARVLRGMDRRERNEISL